MKLNVGSSLLPNFLQLFPSFPTSLFLEFHSHLSDINEELLYWSQITVFKCWRGISSPCAVHNLKRCRHDTHSGFICIINIFPLISLREQSTTNQTPICRFPRCKYLRHCWFQATKYGEAELSICYQTRFVCPTSSRPTLSRWSSQQRKVLFSHIRRQENKSQIHFGEGKRLGI